MILLVLLAMFMCIVGSIALLLVLVISPYWYRARARRYRRAHRSA